MPSLEKGRRTTVVDKERALYVSIRSTFANTKLFLDMLRVENNISLEIGSEKTSGPYFYERKLRSPSPLLSYIWIAPYGSKQATYLSLFSPPKQNASFSQLNVRKCTSQRTEIISYATLCNKIRGVEPQQRFRCFYNQKTSIFFICHQTALPFSGKVPPNVGKHISHLVLKSIPY